VFAYALCLSGRYDARTLTGGFDNDDVYHSNPVAFVPRMNGAQLERARRDTHLDLVVGRGDWEGANLGATLRFGAILRAQGIPHAVEVWGEDAKHDWTWWNRQARHYLGRRLERVPRGARPPEARSSDGARPSVF
jgi:esterase/lipase superfamily enzyme